MSTKVVLIGDSIRMGYQSLVQEKFRECEVWGPVENCRHSLWALDHFQQWVSDQHPDVVHVNFGLHDAQIQPDGEHQILLPQYRLCLQRFINNIKKLEKTKIIWATTTPKYSPEEGKPITQWQVNKNVDIQAYNATALEIVNHEGLPISDLHDVIVRNDFSKCLIEDGCHMTEFGNEVLSDAVVKAIRTLA
jgi:lysophospholipase L1-like esterase